MQIDPEAPSIWFSTASSRVAAAEGLSSLASGATGQLGTAAEAEAEEAGAEDEAGNGRGDAAVEGDELATVSPFAAAAAAGAAPSTTAESSTAPPETEVGGQPARASAAVPPDPSEPIPPADEAAAAAVAEAAAAAAAAAADSGSPQVRARKAASASGASSVGGTSAAGGSMASSRLQLDKQLTLKYPTVITPSGEWGVQGALRLGEAAARMCNAHCHFTRAGHTGCCGCSLPHNCHQPSARDILVTYSAHGRVSGATACRGADRPVRRWGARQGAELFKAELFQESSRVRITIEGHTRHLHSRS